MKNKPFTITFVVFLVIVIGSFVYVTINYAYYNDISLKDSIPTDTSLLIDTVYNPSLLDSSISQVTPQKYVITKDYEKESILQKQASYDHSLSLIAIILTIYSILITIILFWMVFLGFGEIKQIKIEVKEETNKFLEIAKEEANKISKNINRSSKKDIKILNEKIDNLEKILGINLSSSNSLTEDDYGDTDDIEEQGLDHKEENTFDKS